MLVLTRKPGQSIMIGDGIEVEVLSVAGEKIRLGITAPRDVEIFRHEVYERIQDERDDQPVEQVEQGSQNGTAERAAAENGGAKGRRFRPRRQPLPSR